MIGSVNRRREGERESHKSTKQSTRTYLLLLQVLLHVFQLELYQYKIIENKVRTRINLLENWSKVKALITSQRRNMEELFEVKVNIMTISAQS